MVARREGDSVRLSLMSCYRGWPWGGREEISCTADGKLAQESRESQSQREQKRKGRNIR